MDYQQLFIKVTLKNDIHFKQVNHVLVNFLNNAISKDNELLKKHNTYKTFKNYVFCGLFPIEKDGIYKKEKSYFFNVRSTDFLFLKKLQCNLTETNNLKYNNSTINLFDIHYINKIETLTPCVCTIKDNIYWKPGDGLLLLKERIQKNTIRKYNFLYNRNIPEDFEFIQTIQIKSRTPMVYSYKKTSILGVNLSFTINEDDFSQKLGFIIISQGLLEKNTLGFGFCKYE